MTNRPSVRRQSERGATLIHMAIAMVALMAFSALVIDYGIFWVARRQAQNSADAGALAGAIALSFDDSSDLSVNGAASKNAYAATQRNFVWGVAPDVEPATDITIVQNTADNTPIAGCEIDEVCVKVDVYRTVGRSNPLPTFFARLVGVNTQDVRATATARVLQANSTDCLKPWAVADKWDEYDDTTNGAESEYANNMLDPDWNEDTSTYDRYSTGTGKSPPPEDDLYVPPTLCGPGDDDCTPQAGTGFQLLEDLSDPRNDYGRTITLKYGGAEDSISSGWFLPLRLDDSKGGNDYRDNIKECVGITYGVGDTIAIDTTTEQGNKVGPTRQGVQQDSDSLINKDPDAYWDPTLNGGYGGVKSPIYGDNASPRIVPVPVFNADEYLAAGPNGLSEITIRNILGFFVLEMDKQDKGVRGILCALPGKFDPSKSTGPSPFLKQIVLVR